MTIMPTPFSFGGTHRYIKTSIEEFERIDIGLGYFGILFKNPVSKQWHLCLENCGALIGTDKSRANLIKRIKNDVETGDDKIMKTQITMAKKELEKALILEPAEWFGKFRT